MIYDNLIQFWISITVIVYILVLILAYWEAYYNNRHKKYIDLMFISYKDYSAKNIYISYDKMWFWAYFLCAFSIIYIIGAGLYILQYEIGLINLNLNINDITDTVIGLSSIVIGLVCVVVTLVKKYYLFFSIWDVFQFYKIPKYITTVIVTLIGDIVIQVSGLKIDNLYIYSFVIAFTVCNIYCGTQILFRIKQVLLGEKIELTLLKQLYKVFWYNQIDLTNLGDKEYWNEDTIYLNLEYLTRYYFDNDIRNISSIEFVSTLDIIKQKIYKRVRAILIVNNCLILMIIFYRGDFDVCKKINIGLLVGMILFSIIGLKEVKLAVVTMIKGTSGYALQKKTNKYIIIPRGGKVIRKKYKNYVEVMNSICALFYIWIMKSEETELSLCKTEFIKFIDRLYEQEKRLSYEYLPVFTIGYFFWTRGLNVEEVVLEYDKFAVDKNSSAILQRIIYSQIICVTRNFEGNGHEKLDEYLLWLKSC